MTEQLAIMKGVGYGMRDAPVPCLWFETYINDSAAALQCITDPEQIKQVLRDGNVYDVKDLEGKPCFVNVSSGMIEFVRLAKI